MDELYKQLGLTPSTPPATQDDDTLALSPHDIPLPCDDNDEFNKAFRDFIAPHPATPNATSAQATSKKPRKYQLAAIDFLSTHERCILADPPGAGKTPSSIWAAQQNTPPSESILVITPAHLCEHWYNEISALYPEDSLINVSGATRAERERLLGLKARWYIVNTQMFRRAYFVDAIHNLTLRPTPSLDGPANAKSRRVTTVIVDESHYFKNPQAKSSNALYRIINDYKHSNHVPRVYALSATPIMREADDLYMQLRIINPQRFPGHRQFLNSYCWYEWTGFGPYNVALRKGVMEKQFADIILTRSYEEIGLELPPLVSDTIPAELTSERRKAYNDLKLYWRTNILIDPETGDTLPLDTASAMELLHLLRYMTNTPEKREVVTDLLPDNPGPYVVFTFYRKSNNELATTLRAKGYNVTEIHGGVPVDKRAAIASNALRSPTTDNPFLGAKDVVIATIPSLRDGCNLSQANTVIFYEDDYTPGSNYQALSRVRRHRGNDEDTTTADGRATMQAANLRPVICHHIITKNSIDERVFDMQSGRAQHVRGIMQVEMDS